MNKLDIHAGICDSIKDLYRRKNADYGDSFAKARQAVPNYTLGKLYDKFNRYLNVLYTHTADMVAARIKGV